MSTNLESWDWQGTLSQRTSQQILKALVKHGGQITDTWTPPYYQRAPLYLLRIRLPVGKKRDFELDARVTLLTPPKPDLGKPIE